MTAASGIDDSRSQTAYGDYPFRTTQEQLTWQNELVLPLGALTAGVERREERVANDAEFAVTSRDTDSVFGIYRLRAGEQALQANLRHDDSSQYGGGRPARSRTASASRRRCASPPATARASRRRRSTTSTTRNTPTRTSCPRPRATSRAASTGAAGWAGATVEARAVAYRNRIAT